MSQATKRALASALKKLMEKNTLDKISVKDITDLCGLNRQTFYYHFHDTYALLEWLYLDDTKDIREKVYNPDSEFDKYNLILEYITDNKSMVINTFRSFSEDYIMGMLKGWMKPIILEIVRDHIGYISSLSSDLDFIADLYSYSLIGLVFDWVKHDLDKSRLPLFTKYTRNLTGYLELLSEKNTSLRH